MRVATVEMQPPSQTPAPVRKSARNPLYRSAGLALAIEALMLAGLFAWLERPRELPPPQPMTIALAPPVQAPTPAPPKPQPKPIERPRQVPATHPVRHIEQVAHIKPVQLPKPVQQPVAPLAPAPVATAAPTEAAPVSHPAPPPAPSRPDASFEAELRAAIQAALHYPEAARMAGMDGRARVAFVYRDGAVSDVRLVTSSGVGMLDRAAIAAVRDAVYPPPSGAFAGKSLSEQLWVNFNLDNQE